MKNIYSTNTRSELSNVNETIDVQPNAVDLRLGRVFMLTSTPFKISNEEKIHRELVEIHPSKDGYFNLGVGYYNIEYENKIKVAEGEAGYVITRSTLVRNGVYLTTGLYDSGYEGKMVSGMHVTTENMMIKKGTRVGQYLCFDAESLHLYSGDYQEKK